MTELGERLRSERLRCGISQTALAGCDFSPSYVSLIESGRRTPTDAALAVLAARLGTTPDYLRLGDRAPSEERARLDLGFARLALANGEPRAAKERIAAIDLDAISPRHRTETLRTLAEVLEVLGEHEPAVDILEQLLAQARVEGRWLAVAELATALVTIYHEAGDLTRSVEVGEAALSELDARGLEGTDEHLRLGSSLVWSYTDRGDLLYAVHRARSLVEVAERLGSARGRGSVYWNAAIVAQERGEWVQARLLTDRALAHLTEAGADRELPRLRLNYGWLLVHGEQSDPAAALAQLDAAAAGLAAVGTAVEQAMCLVYTGRARLLLGQVEEAESLATDALERLGDDQGLASCEARVLLGDALDRRGERDAAAQMYALVADRLGMQSAGRHAAATWRALADRRAARGDLAEAVAAYRRALDDLGVRAVTQPVRAAPVRTGDQQGA